MTRTRRGMGAVTACVLSVGALAGCSSGLPKQAAQAPVLRVATGVWALGEVAVEIGGEKVSVDDVVPSGTDPLSFRPGAVGGEGAGLGGAGLGGAGLGGAGLGGAGLGGAGLGGAGLGGASLVLLAGGGLQPSLDDAAAAATASGSTRVLRLAEAERTADPYIWLDPAAMEQAVQAVADAMAGADPPAAPLFQRNASGLRSEIGSLDIDYSSTLSTCRTTTMVTPDGALTEMAAHYGLTDLVAAPPLPAPTVAGLASRLAGARGTAITEPWVDDSGARQVAAGAGTRTHALDTLVAPPTGGTPAQNTYLSRMEQVLGTLSAALGCDSGTQ